MSTTGKIALLAIVVCVGAATYAYLGAPKADDQRQAEQQAAKIYYGFAGTARVADGGTVAGTEKQKGLVLTGRYLGENEEVGFPAGDDSVRVDVDSSTIVTRVTYSQEGEPFKGKVIKASKGVTLEQMFADLSKTPTTVTARVSAGFSQSAGFVADTIEYSVILP